MPEFCGFFFIVIAGTVFHFLYDWSGHKKIFAYLCAVNESTWEHMKMVFGPAFLWMLGELPFLWNHPNFFAAKLLSVLIPGVAIPLFFYTYKYILGYHTLTLDIFNFIFSVALGQSCSRLVLQASPLPFPIVALSLLSLVVVLAAYLRFTLHPPRAFLFLDPISGLTGLAAHKEIDRIRKITQK